MTQNTTTPDLIERIARAWSSIDGKTDLFDSCKSDPARDETEGYYSGYMAEAEELAKRAGLTGAPPAAPAAQDGAEVELVTDADELRAELRRALAQIDSLDAECDRRHAQTEAALPAAWKSGFMFGASEAIKAAVDDAFSRYCEYFPGSPCARAALRAHEQGEG